MNEASPEPNRQATPDNLAVFEQSAVLPYRIRDGALEILVVSNQSGGRWVLPKGLVEEDLSPAESAAKEAYEEAGVMGEVSPGPVGCYTYAKWGGTCEVELYLLAVDTLYDDWPERDFRERRWLDRKAASREVDQRVPRKLLKAALARAAAGTDKDAEAGFETTT